MMSEETIKQLEKCFTFPYKQGAKMNQPVCAVFDKKSGMFDSPFVCRHPAEAAREWEAVKKMPETKYGKHPEDYELFQVGNFNHTIGKFENLEIHMQLSSGV